MVTASIKAPTVNLVSKLQALQACIGQPPPSCAEITHRQHLARDLRLDPSLYNWVVFGLSPGSSPRDVRAP